MNSVNIPPTIVYSDDVRLLSAFDPRRLRVEIQPKLEQLAARMSVVHGGEFSVEDVLTSLPELDGYPVEDADVFLQGLTSEELFDLKESAEDRLFSLPG